MKRIILLAFFFISISAMAQRKVALIVAIGEYPTNSGWGNLSSVNDTKYITEALLKQGFDKNDIALLLNQQATRAGILNALDELYNRVRPDDVVIFHFSGHGQQIYDDNGDELDGYDEALIPYDASARYDPVSYKGENHLRDDILGQKLKRIRERIGSKGSLIVLIDACHSGTSTRGEKFPMRGTPVPFTKPGYKPVISTKLGPNGEEESFIGAGMGNFVLFSASNPHQVNFETKDADNVGVGSLSYAFAKSLNEMKPGTSYGMLFRKIRAIIQSQFPQQVPMIEGDQDLEIFGGKVIPQESYIGVERWLSDTTMLINIGFMNNIAKGAKFTLYALNDKDETMPVAEGYIALAGTFQSHGIINKAIPRGEVYKVKIDETGFGDLAASLSFQFKNEKGELQSAMLDQKGTPQSLLVSQITNFIRPYQFLTINASPDYLFDIKPSKNGFSIQLIDKSDSTRWTETIAKGDTLSAAALKKMLDNLKKAMRINYLRNMPDGGAMANNIIVEITPLSNPAAADDVWMKEGDKFKIRIVNNNPYKVYFNLVDITPDNGVKVLIPYSDNGETVEDFVIQGNGGVFAVDELLVDMGTPSGREFMKFFFTKTAMDLRPVLARSGTRGPANKSGVENVFNDMFKDGNDEISTRSSIPSKVKVEEVGVVTRSFSIKK